jgi:hypothetical protein
LGRAVPLLIAASGALLATPAGAWVGDGVCPREVGTDAATNAAQAAHFLVVATWLMHFLWSMLTSFVGREFITAALTDPPA